MASNATDAEDCGSFCYANTIMWSILLPPLLCTGLTGNLLIVLVFSTSRTLRRRKPVLCVTMVTLACSDALVFLFPVTRHWLRQAKMYVEVDVQTLGAGVCKAHEFFVYFSVMFSTWMVVLVSAERFTIVCFPLRRSRLLTTRRVLGIIVAMATGCCLVNAQILWTREFAFSTKHDRLSCQNSNTDIAKIIVNIHARVDMVASVILPFLLLLLFSALIAHRLYQRSRQLKSIAAGVVDRGRRRLLTPTTRMLLPVPLVFVPLTLPAKLWLLINSGKGIPTEVQNNTPEYHWARFRWSCMLFLQFSNYASNFFIYSLMSADFRADLARLLCRCRRTRQRSAAAAATRGPAPQQPPGNSRDDVSSVYHLDFRVQTRC